MSAGATPPSAQPEALDDAPPVRREALLAHVLAHEVRAPLVTIAHACEALAATGGDGGGYLRMIERNARAIARTVEDLVVLTERGSWALPLRVEDAVLEDVVREAVEDARPSARDAGVGLRFRPGGVGAVRVDPERLRQLVTGLLDNAAKYTPTGGRVTVETAPVGADRLRIAVTDNGPGVPAEDWEVVFDPFHRGSATGGTAGSGVGLAVVRAVAAAHGGTVDLRQAAGGGASFVVDLPRIAAGSAAA